MTRIGFIGLGTMGQPMARHIAQNMPAGTSLALNDRSVERAQPMLDLGASWAETARELAATSDLVICMVPAIDHVRTVCDGPDGLLAGIQGPLTLVVCSSVAATDVRELDAWADELSDGRLRVVDAPVSGGQVGAEAGTLSIMVGGPEKLVGPVVEVLNLTGTAAHLGPLGAGQVAKACNQAIVAATITAIAEASVVAERSGLDVGQLFELLQGGYASSAVLKDKASRFATKDYSPSGPLWFWIKDLKAYLAEAQATGTDSLVVGPILAAVEGLVESGRGDADTAVIQEWIEQGGQV
ncbi:NAD(P)-dependent oxidoreductase [Luteococcus sp. H154]|uniref:NAD(P)-dependent oxidoreductase n=1 Tax=unclassified Luteococcus TaxID=2639923 RepID=UPI00313DF0C2